MEEIQTRVAEDMSYNETNVLQKQFELTSRKQFWVTQLFNAKREHLFMTRKKDTLLDGVAVAYTGQQSISIKSLELSLKKKDANFAKLILDIEDLQIKIDYLTEVSKIYNSATYDIKNIAELQKLNAMG